LIPRSIDSSLRLPKPRTSSGGRVAPFERNVLMPYTDRARPSSCDDRLFVEALRQSRDRLESGFQPAQLWVTDGPGVRTTARTPVAASAATSMPRSSIGNRYDLHPGRRETSLL